MIFLNFLSVTTKRGFNVIDQNNHNFPVSTLWKKKTAFRDFLYDFFSSIRFAFRTRTKGRNHEFLTLKFIRGSTLKKYDLNLHYPMASLSHFTALLAKIFKYEHHNIMPQIVVFLFLWFASQLFFLVDKVDGCFWYGKILIASIVREFLSCFTAHSCLYPPSHSDLWAIVWSL